MNCRCSSQDSDRTYRLVKYSQSDRNQHKIVLKDIFAHKAGLHSDGYSTGSSTFTYLCSVPTRKWKATFAYADLSATYETLKIEEFGKKLAMNILERKGWQKKHNMNDSNHKVLWTKLQNENGFKVPYDVDQQAFFGLPEGWEGMNDEAIAKAQKARDQNKPYDDREKWAFELILPTVC